MNANHLAPKTKRVLLGTLLISVVLGFSFLVYNRLEWEEKEIDLGYSKAARLNNFLAAEIFLRKHGVQAISVKNLSVLDTQQWRAITLGDADTLVLINAHKTFTATRYNNLYNWVENGGTLITSTQNPFIGVHTDEQDLLLKNLGVTPAKEKKRENPKDFLTGIADELEKNAAKSGSKSEKENEPERPDNYARCNLEKAPTEISFANEAAPLHFDFSGQDAFSYRRREHDVSEEAHLVSFDVGRGSIIVTSDNNIWSNRRIDCHDHAYALWSLVNPSGRVWFLVNQDAPSLTALIWHHAHYAVLASMLALLSWLWKKSSRFGPVFVSSGQARRSLAEHIYASATLLWRNQQHPQLAKLLRQEIFERFEQQHARLSEGAINVELVQLIEQLTGLKKSEILLALYEDDLHQPHVFSTAIAYMQIIRKHL